jgi:hypothetical protein
MSNKRKKKREKKNYPCGKEEVGRVVVKLVKVKIKESKYILILLNLIKELSNNT